MLLELRLRSQLPGIKFHQPKDFANSKKRACLEWNGLNIIWARTVEPPKGTDPQPLDAEELAVLLADFTKAAEETIGKYGLAPPATEEAPA